MVNSVECPYAYWLNVILLKVILLNVILLNVILPFVILLNGILPIVILLNAIKHNVIFLKSPFPEYHLAECHECQNA
jgi:hypothetical protein